MAATERMNSHMSVSEFHCVATTTKITQPSHFQSQRLTPAMVRSSFIAARRPTSPHLLGPVLDRRPRITGHKQNGSTDSRTGVGPADRSLLTWVSTGP